MVEETKNPEKIFPRMMFTGLGIAVIIYMLVAVSVVAVIPAGDIATPDEPRGGHPARRRTRRCAGHPDRQGLPVHDGLRGRQHRADQHADGEPADLRHGQPGRAAARPRQGAARPALAVGRPSCSPPCSRSGLIVVVRLQAENSVVAALSGTTALLLLAVFSVVNVAVLVLRREPGRRGRLQGAHGRAGARCRRLPLPARPVGAAGGRHDPVQDRRRACSPLGVVLWVVTCFVNRATGTTSTGSTTSTTWPADHPAYAIPVR